MSSVRPDGDETPRGAAQPEVDPALRLSPVDQRERAREEVEAEFEGTPRDDVTDADAFYPSMVVDRSKRAEFEKSWEAWLLYLHAKSVDILNAGRSYAMFQMEAMVKKHWHDQAQRCENLLFLYDKMVAWAAVYHIPKDEYFAMYNVFEDVDAALGISRTPRPEIPAYTPRSSMIERKSVRGKPRWVHGGAACIYARRVCVSVCV